MRRFLGNRLQLTLPINRVAGGMNTRWCDRTHRNGYMALVIVCFIAGTFFTNNLSLTRTYTHPTSIEMNPSISEEQPPPPPPPPPLPQQQPQQEQQQQEQQNNNKSDNNDYYNLTFPSSNAINDFYHSQAGQDKWIFERIMLSDLNEYRRRGGFFIEFGARDGIRHSNTYFLEHFLGWKGLLIEANPSELNDIVFNRPDSAIISGAICSSDSITFLHTGVEGWDGDKASYDSQRYAAIKHKAKEVQVKCYTLDYLTQYLQLDEVDIMTVDTEGSELSALQTFPFERIQPKLIAVELLVGNAERDKDRNKLESFMKTKGYKIYHEYWVSMQQYTLDLFFTLDGQAPTFSNKTMTPMKREFRTKVAKCQAEGLCLK